MTRTEKSAFNQWNMSITDELNRAWKAAEATEGKYKKAPGTRFVCPETFILEISLNTDVDAQERIQDIRTITAYMSARAKRDAMVDILHIQK